MKKKLLGAILCGAMVMSLLAGCGGDAKTGGDANQSQGTEADAPKDDGGDAGQEADADKDSEAGKDAEENKEAGKDGEASAGDKEGTYAILVKSAGNPYNKKMIEGFQEIMDAQGATAVVKEPEAASAEDQIKMINELVAQGISSIAIAGNDVDALQPALEEAMNKGVKVCCMDSPVNADSRQLFVNQAGIEGIGETLMEAVYDITGGEGQWAILSATSQASNQNAWIDAMKKVMEDEKYAGLELVEVAYGDDEYQKSVDQTQALLTNYPDLKVICAPTTVGIMAAAKVLQDEGSSVKLTGLGLPSEMAKYIGDDDAHSCPYMYLWNPIDIGRLTAYVSLALVDGSITGAEGETFTAGELGEYTVSAASDGGTEVILGPPFAFTPENIDEWKDVY